VALSRRAQREPRQAQRSAAYRGIGHITQGA